MSADEPKSGSGSTEERASLATEFLYDFVYVDRQRVESYFAQLNPNGTLTKIIDEVSETQENSQTSSVGPRALYERFSERDQAAQSFQQHFDPAWVLPITVLDRLDEIAFVRRSLEEASLGSLVLLKGGMQILDIRMLRELWPHFGKAALQAAAEAAGEEGNRQQRRSAQRRAGKSRPSDDEVDLLGAIGKLPHALQLQFVTGEEAAWGTLAAENMTINPDDFALKHGMVIAGEWHMLAIVDATTEEPSLPTHVALYQNELAVGMYQFLLHTRHFFGRPSGCYGVTPLLIFRALRRAE